MLKKVESYFSQSKNYLINLLNFNKPHTFLKGLCCISITADTLTIVYANHINSKINIQICDSFSYKNDFVPFLTTFVKNNNLKGVSCALMLQPDDYQSLITDALPVPPEEFQAAIRWKVKDLLRFSIDDVVLDSFVIPKMKTGEHDKIMIIAAQASKLKTTCNELLKCGLKVDFIDIPELGLRNIINLYGNQTVIFIYIQIYTIQLIILSDENIFIIRQLKFSLSTEDENKLDLSIDRLTAEIQRSLDYYQSLWNAPLPTLLLLSSMKPLNKETIDSFSQKIKLPIKIINLKEVLDFNLSLDLEKESQFLPVIGGVLRLENERKSNARD